MNPSQLRETTMAPDTRRLVKLTLDEPATPTIDMLLSKNRAGDRKTWLMEEGNKAEILE
jgi:topoisomerase-4 subunit B